MLAFAADEMLAAAEAFLLASPRQAAQPQLSLSQQGHRSSQRYPLLLLSWAAVLAADACYCHPAMIPEAIKESMHNTDGQAEINRSFSVSNTSTLLPCYNSRLLMPADIVLQLGKRMTDHYKILC